MTKATGKTPREALLNETLIGFHADLGAARKTAATASGKVPRRDQQLENSLPDLGMGAETAAQDKAGT
jgi:hypothetical protein